MPALAGRFGKVQILDGIAPILTATRWTATWKVDALDATNMESTQATNAASTQGHYIAGVADVDVTIDVPWDINLANPGSTIPPGFAPGVKVQLALYLNRSAGNSTLKGMLQVENLTLNDEVRGVFNYTLTGKLNQRFNVNLDTADTTLFHFPTN